MVNNTLKNVQVLKNLKLSMDDKLINSQLINYIQQCCKCYPGVYSTTGKKTSNSLGEL